MKEKTLFKQRFNSGTWKTSTHVKLGERMKDVVHMKKAIEDITKIHRII